MGIRQITGNLLAIAILGAAGYGFLHWQGGGTGDSESAAFAERACVDEAGARYNVTNIKPISIKKSANGFVVRASVRTARGTPAMAICLANTHGGVRDISIDER